MYNNKKFLAIIPARGGSKGLPRKNIKELNGKPLIAYSIEAAINSKIFDKIIVSTDDKEIAEVALKYGAEVPFVRPRELATDTADSMDVLFHTINFLKKNGEEYDYIMKLQPTSPLRTEKEILEATKLLFEKKAESIVSISECEHHPLWTNTLDSDKRLFNFIKEDIKHKNRQDLPNYYQINGLIFLSEINNLLKTRDWYGKKSYAYVCDSKKAIDIDNIIDFKLAEILLKEIYKND